MEREPAASALGKTKKMPREEKQLRPTPLVPVSNSPLLAPENTLTHIVMSYLENFLSSHTRSAYQADFRDFGAFLSANGLQVGHPKDVRKRHVIAYRDFLREKYSPTSINRKLSALSSLFQELQNAQAIETNPVEGVKRPPSKTTKPRLGFTDREVNQILNAYPGERLPNLQKRSLLHFLFFTGVRISEALNVRCRDVCAQKTIGVVTIRGKGEKIRTLPLHPKLYNTLLELIARTGKTPDHYLFTRIKITTGQSVHSPISRQAGHLFLKRTLKKLGLDENRSLHSSRRTVISNLLESGSRIENVAELAGHANINTTQRYNVRKEELEDNPLLTLRYQE